MYYSPEKLLIIYCLQSKNCDQARANCQELIDGPLNWDIILGTAISAKIASSFFHQLQSLGLDQRIPPAVRNKFEKTYYKIGFQNIRIFEELNRLVQMLSAARVDVIVLKGCALLAEVWNNPSLREMADIDLLVRSEDLTKTDSILKNHGYRTIENWRSAEYYRRHHHHLAPYFNPKAAYRIPIEIHHNIKLPTDSNSVDISDFWKSSREIAFRNYSLNVLSPEDLIVHLCMHMTYNKNFLKQIRYLLDISQTVAHFRTAIQWDSIVRVAHSPVVASCIYYSLYFSKIMLKAAIPEKVLDQISRQVSVSLLSHHLLRYLVKRYSLVSITGTPSIPIYKLKFLCRDIVANAMMVEKIRTVWHGFLFPPKPSVSSAGDEASCLSTHSILYYPKRAGFIGIQLFKNLFSR